MHPPAPPQNPGTTVQDRARDPYRRDPQPIPQPVGRTRSGALSTAALVAAAIAIAIAGCDLTGTSATTVPADRRTPNALVTHIIDGDTIIVAIGDAQERVRLIGIDTPEIAHPERGTVSECMGPEATDFTTSLLPEGTPIHLQRDTEARDDYGRILGYIYRSSDGVFINYEIVRHGFATPLSIAPNDTYSSLFANAASLAHRDRVGIWAHC